jgi:hypothetical protein
MRNAQPTPTVAMTTHATIAMTYTRRRGFDIPQVSLADHPDDSTQTCRYRLEPRTAVVGALEELRPERSTPFR